MTISVCVLSTFPRLLPSMCQALCGVVLRRLKSAGISRALRMFRSNCSSASEGTSSKALERNCRFIHVIDNHAVWISPSCILLITLCFLICITGMHYNSIWFDKRLLDHNGAGVSHLSYVQQNKTATSSFLSQIIALLLLFHPGNVPAGRICMVPSAICRKQIAVPLRTTSFLFPAPNQQGVSRWEKQDCCRNPLSPFNYCCLCLSASTYTPFTLQYQIPRSWTDTHAQKNNNKDVTRSKLSYGSKHGGHWSQRLRFHL